MIARLATVVTQVRILLGSRYLTGKVANWACTSSERLYFQSNRASLFFWGGFCRGRSAGEDVLELGRTAEKFLCLLVLQPDRHAAAFLSGARYALLQDRL